MKLSNLANQGQFLNAKERELENWGPQLESTPLSTQEVGERENLVMIIASERKSATRRRFRRGGDAFVGHRTNC